MDGSEKFDVNRIIARASTLAERLANAQSLTDFNEVVATTRWEKCVRLGARGSTEFFNRQLAWDGLTTSTVRLVLGSQVSQAEVFAPPWSKILAEVHRLLGCDGAAFRSQATTSERQDSIPFEELLIPFVVVGQKVLRKSMAVDVPDVDQCAPPTISNRAQSDIERDLLTRLSGIAGACLYHEFDHFRTIGQSLVARSLKSQAANASRARYEEFVQSHLRDGYTNLFHTYPVLGRLLAICVLNWANHVSEFLSRLRKDFPIIKDAFGIPSERESTTVKSLVMSVSDPHNNGRGVIWVTLESEAKFVYKPVDVSSLGAFQNLIAWCNLNDSNINMRVLQVIPCMGYGWVEHVDPHAYNEITDHKLLFHDAGGLLSLLHLVQANDCHYENLILTRQHFVLVDAETLLHPDARAFTDIGRLVASEGASDCFRRSVLRTGFLPGWNERKAVDVSALGNLLSDKTGSVQRIWRNVNTDLMALNAPRMRETSAGPPVSSRSFLTESHVRALLDGFSSVYRLLLRKKELLLAPEGPLLSFQKTTVRFLFRDTQIYSNLLRNSLLPEALLDGVEHSLEFMPLRNAFLGASERPFNWSIAGAEADALEQLDIPYFCTEVDAVSLVTSHGMVREGFLSSGHEALIQQVKSLSEQDRNFQCRLIVAACDAYQAQPSPDGNWAGLGFCLRAYSETETLLDDRDRYILQAREIGSTVLREAFEGTNGALSWIGLEFNSTSNRYALSPIGYDLYNGRVGVALFFAALFSCTGDVIFECAARGALAHFRTYLDTATDHNLRQFSQAMGLGGTTGLGSLVYGLVRCSDLLGDVEILKSACRVAMLITEEMIVADRQMDISSGSAGALLALLALNARDDQPWIKRLLHACGRRLIESQLPNPCGAWPTVEGMPLLGFAHGAAGISYALSKLYAVTRDDRYRDSALLGFNYERSKFDVISNAWPDLRMRNGAWRAQMGGWCSGSSGMGLARLGSHAVFDTEELYDDLNKTLALALVDNPDEVVNLCCGTLGRIELLLAAGERLDRRDLIQAARRLADAVLCGRRLAVSWGSLRSTTEGTLNPGLFQGISGLGYEMLRVVSPKSLTSVLLFE